VKGLVRNVTSYKGLSHPNLSLITGDLFHDLSGPMQQADIVIHAAAETKQGLLHQSDYNNINFKGTNLLYLTAKQFHVRKFIFISSSNTIGYGSLNKPGTESQPIKWPFAKSYYAKSKLEAENYLLQDNTNMDVIIINPTFMLGAWDSKPSSGKIIRMGWNKHLVFCPPGGKNFVHVQDVVQAIVQSLHHGKNHEKYLIAGENLSYFEFFGKLRHLNKQKTILIKLPPFIMIMLGYAGEILRLFGFNSNLSLNNMRILCVNNYYSNQKSVLELGLKYSPVDLAIEDTLAFFKQSRDNNSFAIEPQLKIYSK
jgi:dihydroflavonol-4-reductase